MATPAPSIFDVPPIHHARFWRPLLNHASWYERSHREELETIIRARAWIAPPSREMGDSISTLLRVRLPALIATWQVPHDSHDAPAIADLAAFLSAWLLHNFDAEPHSFVWPQHGVLAIAASIGCLPLQRLEAVKNKLLVARERIHDIDPDLARLIEPVITAIGLAQSGQSPAPCSEVTPTRLPENVHHDRDLLRVAAVEIGRWNKDAGEQFLSAADNITLD